MAEMNRGGTSINTRQRERSVWDRAKMAIPAAIAGSALVLSGCASPSLEGGNRPPVATADGNSDKEPKRNLVGTEACPSMPDSLPNSVQERPYADLDEHEGKKVALALEDYYIDAMGTYTNKRDVVHRKDGVEYETTAWNHHNMSGHDGQRITFRDDSGKEVQTVIVEKAGTQGTFLSVYIGSKDHPRGYLAYAVFVNPTLDVEDVKINRHDHIGKGGFLQHSGTKMCLFSNTEGFYGDDKPIYRVKAYENDMMRESTGYENPGTYWVAAGGTSYTTRQPKYSLDNSSL